MLPAVKVIALVGTITFEVGSLMLKSAAVCAPSRIVPSGASRSPPWLIFAALTVSCPPAESGGDAGEAPATNAIVPVGAMDFSVKSTLETG